MMYLAAYVVYLAAYVVYLAVYVVYLAAYVVYLARWDYSSQIYNLYGAMAATACMVPRLLQPGWCHGCYLPAWFAHLSLTSPHHPPTTSGVLPLRRAAAAAVCPGPRRARG